MADDYQPTDYLKHYGDRTELEVHRFDLIPGATPEITLGRRERLVTYLAFWEREGFTVSQSWADDEMTLRATITNSHAHPPRGINPDQWAIVQHHSRRGQIEAGLHNTLWGGGR